MNEYKKNLKNVLKAVEQETLLPAAHIRLHVRGEEEAPVGLCGSKLSGTPYIPHNEQAPANVDGEPLILLAQINLSELNGLGGLPKKGLLQFFIADDDTYGLTEDGGYAVRYYPVIDESVTEEECSDKYCPDISEVFPVQMEYALSFEKSEEPMTVYDYRFGELFAKHYNKAFPDKHIDSVYDLSDDDMEFLFGDDEDTDEAVPADHKLLGYPIFAQDDPREESGAKYDRLLLRIDCDMSEYIMWGDGGGANFFISSDNLKKADFSDILYTWDCF